MRFFIYSKWFGHTNSAILLINVLKYFWSCFEFAELLKLFMHYVFSQYAYRFVPHILSIRTDSPWVFSKYAQQNSVWKSTVPYCKQTDSFRVFSVCVKIPLVYLANLSSFLCCVRGRKLTFLKPHLTLSLTAKVIYDLAFLRMCKKFLSKK